MVDKGIFLLLHKNKFYEYRNNPKYWDRQVWANSLDPDQTPQNTASDLCLHCLPLIQQYFRLINR